MVGQHEVRAIADRADFCRPRFRVSAGPRSRATSASGSITTPLPITQNLAAPQNAGRNQMEHVFRAAMDDGVAGIVTALAAHHDVRLRGQHVDDLALAFVAPLRADQNCVRHESGEMDNKSSRASGRTRTGLRGQNRIRAVVLQGIFSSRRGPRKKWIVISLTNWLRCWHAHNPPCPPHPSRSSARCQPGPTAPVGATSRAEVSSSSSSLCCCS